MSETTYKAMLCQVGRSRSRQKSLMLLNLCEGEQLILTVKDNTVFVRSRTRYGLDLLAEIRRGFVELGISEEEFLEEGRRIREERAREQYGAD